MHGYQLSQYLEHQLASVVPMKRSTAYFLLNKLSKRGLVYEKADREGRRPERRVYRLTPEGDAAFGGSLRDHLGRHAPTQFPDAVGLLFLDFVSPIERVQLLNQRLREVSEQADLADEQTRAHSATRVRLAMSYRASVLRGERDWLRSILDELSSASDQEKDTPPRERVLSGGSSR